MKPYETHDVLRFLLVMDGHGTLCGIGKALVREKSITRLDVVFRSASSRGFSLADCRNEEIVGCQQCGGTIRV